MFDNIVIETIDDYFQHPFMPPTETEKNCWKHIKKEIELIPEDIELLLSLVPDWASEAIPGLFPTMYGTGTYEGDCRVRDRLNEIKARYLPDNVKG